MGLFNFITCFVLKLLIDYRSWNWFQKIKARNLFLKLGLPCIWF